MLLKALTSVQRPPGTCSGDCDVGRIRNFQVECSGIVARCCREVARAQLPLGPNSKTIIAQSKKWPEAKRARSAVFYYKRAGVQAVTTTGLSSSELRRLEMSVFIVFNV